MKYKQLHRELKHAYVKVGDEHLERWKALQKEGALYTNPQKWDIEWRANRHIKKRTI